MILMKMPGSLNIKISLNITHGLRTNGVKGKLNQQLLHQQRKYEAHLTLRVNQSTQQIALSCRGQGLEPRLEFARSQVAFGPILPHSPGDTQELTVKNPCSFPIEMYSLEFDKVYLEEEMERLYVVWARRMEGSLHVSIRKRHYKESVKRFI